MARVKSNVEIRSHKRVQFEGTNFFLQISVTTMERKIEKLNERKVFYKIGKIVTGRKPSASKIKNGEVVVFSVATNGAKLPQVKDFLTYVITDQKQLTFLKNDVGFLMNELYGSAVPNTSNSGDDNLQCGTIIYVWVHLGFPYSPSVSSRISSKIFAFDLYFLPRRIPEEKMKYIADTLKRGADVKIHSRRVNEFPECPFSVRVM